MNHSRLITAVLAAAICHPVSSQNDTFTTVVEKRSHADPPTGDSVSSGVITPLDQEMRNFHSETRTERSKSNSPTMP